MDSYPLITTIVASIVFAFIFGMIAKKLKLPSLIGFLAAGVLLGPYTPGYIADADIAHQLAEIGIILLMFGVGLHFKPRELLAVRRVALPGAVAQIAVATCAGCILAMIMGQPIAAGLLFGLALSTASTVVLLRTLEQRNEVTSVAGRIAVGWLIVEDVAMVLAIVMLPALATMINSGITPTGEMILGEIFEVLLKIGALIIVMMTIARRFLPRVLVAIAKTKSRELQTLGTIAIALGFAYIAYNLFDASFALGAFLAGLVLNESEIGRKSAEQTLPLRDIFSVIFFVSVGMLFDPKVLIDNPVMVVGTLAIIILFKSAAAYGITKLLQQTRRVSLTVAASLAQIGEFSFILAGMGLTTGLMSTDLYNLVLAGAILSIAINPFLFRLMDKVVKCDEQENEQAQQKSTQ